MFLMAGSAMASQTAPSDRIHLGVIGSGGRGTSVMGTFQKDAAVRVAAICDVYEPNLERALSAAAKVQGGETPRAIRDYRRLLDDRSIQAVLIATPEHWHHRMVLDALAAGKDIYVEKPLCQTPEQGVELVRAGDASRSIVQVGMQRRSYDLYLEGRRIIAGGTLGNVRMVRSWWLNNYVNQPRAARLDGPLVVSVRSNANSVREPPGWTVRSTGSSGRGRPPGACRWTLSGSATGATSLITRAASRPIRGRMPLTASTC